MSQGERTDRFPRLRIAFLAAYAECGVITRAAKAVGCSRNNHCNWMAKSPKYREMFALAQEEANDLLESEARKRAVKGWEEPVYQGGLKVGTKRKFSDLLLIFLMKGAMPDKYKDRVAQEVSMDVNATVQIVEDSDWYGNSQTVGGTAEADGSSTADPA